MAFQIEVPEGDEALTEFIEFFNQVYEYRGARWGAEVDFQLPVLNGESPYARHRSIRPLLAREGEDIVARLVAVVDQPYIRHWNEKLGHIGMFEALPGRTAAVRRLFDTACEWLRQQGMEKVRAGFHFATFEMPYAIDDYESLPPMMVRQNPPYYHSLLKESGFIVEKGWVDYKIRVCPELQRQWAAGLETVRRSGFEIIPLKDVPKNERVGQFTRVWNEAFRAHWGMIPASEEELSVMFAAFEPTGMLETSVLTYREGVPVGALLVVPEMTSMAQLKPGRTVRDSEKLNILGIGVLEPARGTGVNLAMSAYAFQELIRRGAKYLSYTMVVDHNWPSRRTGEKLGAEVCANYLTYLRSFR